MWPGCHHRLPKRKKDWGKLGNRIRWNEYGYDCYKIEAERLRRARSMMRLSQQGREEVEREHMTYTNWAVMCHCKYHLCNDMNLLRIGGSNSSEIKTSWCNLQIIRALLIPYRTQPAVDRKGVG